MPRFLDCGRGIANPNAADDDEFEPRDAGRHFGAFAYMKKARCYGEPLARSLVQAAWRDAVQAAISDDFQPLARWEIFTPTGNFPFLISA